MSALLKQGFYELKVAETAKHGRSIGHRDMDGTVAKWLTPFGTTSKGNGN